MNYIERFQRKYPEVTGKQNQFSNHPNKIGVKDDNPVLMRIILEK